MYRLTTEQVIAMHSELMMSIQIFITKQHGLDLVFHRIMRLLMVIRELLLTLY